METIIAARLDSFHGNSDRTGRGLRHLVWEKGVVRWKKFVTHKGAFGLLREESEGRSCPCMAAVHHVRSDLAPVKVEDSRNQVFAKTVQGTGHFYRIFSSDGSVGIPLQVRAV